MAKLTIRDLDDAVKRRLRAALVEVPHGPENLVEAIRRRFAPLGGLDVDISKREPMRKPPRVIPKRRLLSR